jgi:homoserine kinase
VRVPATSANLGPGFDCLALALSLSNTFDVALDLDHRGTSEVTIRGDRRDTACLTEPNDNLFLRAFTMACQSRDVAVPRMRLTMHVNLPPGRGLGSSATAVVGGIIAANALLGNPLTQADMLDLAVRCEPGHHPDNVAAALLGGLVITGVRNAEGRLIAERVALNRAARAVVFIPDMPMSTLEGRSLLPPAYAREDVTFNLSRVALLVAGLHSGRFDLLGLAMDDRMHQPYRQKLFPALPDLISAAREGGALGACLSGGGSSVLALVDGEENRVRDAMTAEARRLGIAGDCVIADIAHDGALATIMTPMAVGDE